MIFTREIKPIGSGRCEPVTFTVEVLGISDSFHCLNPRRVTALLPTIKKLKSRGVRVAVNTKPIDEHDDTMADQAELGIYALQEMDITVLMTVGHHRKIAIIDDILYEGSLNILSRNDSCELMLNTTTKRTMTRNARF